MLKAEAKMGLAKMGLPKKESFYIMDFKNILTGFWVGCIFFILIIFSSFLVSSNNALNESHGNLVKKINLCEKDLPRSKKCYFIAVPEDHASLKPNGKAQSLQD